MTNRQDTSNQRHRIAWLCILGVFAPHRLGTQQQSARLVQHAFWWSLVLVLGSAGVGYLAGMLLDASLACASSRLIAFLQGSGAAVLLWATLFVRGWEIQTTSGKTLVEQINRSLYRFMYCVGTALIVASLPLSPCIG